MLRQFTLELFLPEVDIVLVNMENTHELRSTLTENLVMIPYLRLANQNEKSTQMISFQCTTCLSLVQCQNFTATIYGRNGIVSVGRALLFNYQDCKLYDTFRPVSINPLKQTDSK